MDKQNFAMRHLNKRYYLPHKRCHIAIYGTTRTGKCLGEDTPVVVQSSKGRKVARPIKTLPEHFKALSYNFETKQQEFKDAVKEYRGELECYEITLEDGSTIIASEEHKFYDLSGKVVVTNTLEAGDCLFGDKTSISIKSVFSIGKKKVWNIEVKDNHNFFLGNGVLSKNSQTLKHFAEAAFLRGYKIFDLYSAGMQEAFYWALKSNHPFWDNREYKYGNKTTKAMEFPVKVLIPMAEKLASHGQLPDICQPFTIPITSLTEADLKVMLGNTLTKNEIPLWRRVSEKITKSTTLTDLLNYILDMQKGGERMPGIHATAISSLHNMISSFEKHKLFSSEKNPLALDLEAEVRNRKVITALEFKYCPDELWWFLINHFIYKLLKIVTDETIKHPVIVLFREAGDFLANMGGSASPQEEAIQGVFDEAVRKGLKRNLCFWIDNQTALNLTLIKSQFNVKVCHRVDNIASLQNALGDMGSMLLTQQDYMNLMSFKPGKCFVLEENKGLYNPQMLPPLSRMSGAEGADFVEIWRSEKGERFKNIKAEIQPVIDEYEESKQKWTEDLATRKEKDRLIRQLDKHAKEKEKEAKKREKAIMAKKPNLPPIPAPEPTEEDEMPIEQMPQTPYVSPNPDLDKEVEDLFF